jgi:hypothetical protein
MKSKSSIILICRCISKHPKLFDTAAFKVIDNILSGIKVEFPSDVFFNAIEFHRLSQLAYINLKTYNEFCNCHSEYHKIPDSIIDRLRIIYFSNAVRNEYLLQELVSINELLNENNIEVINWKGPALALQAYGDLSLRRFQDLDIWIKYNDFEKTREILTKNGFKDCLEDIKEANLNCRGEYFHPIKKYMIEFDCYMLFAKVKIEYKYKESFDNASILALNSHSIKSFSTIENLFFVCFHGMKHYWKRQIWLTDAVALFEATTEDVLKELDSFYQKDIIIFTLYLGYTKLNLDVPEEIHKRFDIRAYKKELKALVKFRHCKYFINYYQTKLIYRLIKGDENKKNLKKMLKYYRPYKILFRLMLPSQTDYNFMKLPKLLYPLYFAIRPLRVIKKKLSKRQNI